ncbi:hypothetical protein LEP1GSC029_3162 [Leptospira interrogans str. 2002000626]|uniref:DNA-binding helix-turn-helix protein n=3 Tax=Leptospira interrogans TaxID=173 RepID=A0A829DD13_LEPIR|nr:hypothetical protein LEP1GSC025_2171 [Leptospira interrogans str. 2002000621]EMY06256.1 hypothetical protein LEP1GSC029_3162 [Leptospira interrogans str. 2002000626]EMY25676.1 hypothetical protein LEP1GSC115_1469 [Leptospira interrogans serovar Australis str. 200703203]
MKTLREFAKEAEINYDYLSKSLNGQHSYTEVRDAFNKFGVPYRMQSRKNRLGKNQNRRFVA